METTKCPKCGWQWGDAGECDRCALLDRDRKAADYDRLHEDWQKAVRVAYEITPDCQTVEEACAALVEQVKVARAERDEARARIALLTECNEAMRAPMSKLRVAAGMPAEGESAVVDAVLASLAKKTSNLSAAEARAKALEAALRGVERGLRETARNTGLSRGEGWMLARVVKALSKSKRTTPPADLTQHPAYRAGVEAAAKVCVAEHGSHVQAATRTGDPRHARMLAEGRALVAARLEDEIRALLDTKEARDDE